MILEEFMQYYDPKANYRYIKDSEGVQLVTPYITRPTKLMHVLNPHMASTKEPKALMDLPMESQNEGVYCNTCHCTLAIRRVRPKITSRLSSQYSPYVPTPLNFCVCRAMATEVDSRGRLRVYGEAHNIALVNYLEGFPIHHRLSNQKHAEIPRELLDSPRLVYSNSYRPRYMWLANHIDLSYLTVIEQELLLPTERSNMPKRLYHQAYAYKYKIAILTKKYLVLPNGVAISTRDPLLKSLLGQRIDPPKYMRDMAKATVSSILRSAKTNIEILEHANSIIRDLTQTLVDHYHLPEAPIIERPFQVIGHLQLARLDRWECSKGYISKLYKRALLTVRNATRSHLRSIALGLPFTVNTRTLLPPPPYVLLYSQSINSKKSPSYKVRLYKGHRYIELREES